MPYKISGSITHDCRIVIIKEEDWTIESNTLETATSYEITGLENNKKSIFAREASGQGYYYGNVDPEEYYVGGDRGVFAGGRAPDYDNTIDYITISTTGNATNFGDRTVRAGYVAGMSNAGLDRGITGGGQDQSAIATNILDYVTISTTGNATDYGDLAYTPKQGPGAVSNGTNDRGVFAGGYTSDGVSTMHYVTINTTGNSTNFGSLTVARGWVAGASNGENERGLFAGGGAQGSPFNKDVIDYITISTTGAATDFGDLIAIGNGRGGCSNGINDKAVFCGRNEGGYHDDIDTVTISTTANATDFGNLTTSMALCGGTSNGTNDRGVVAGGAGNTINHMTISNGTQAFDFGDLTRSSYGLAAFSNASVG